MRAIVATTLFAVVGALTQVPANQHLTDVTSGCRAENPTNDSISVKENPTRNESQQVGRSLDEIIQNLRKFVTSVGFDYGGFETHTPALKNVLEDLELITVTDLNYQEFTTRLAFVKRVFETMVDATDKLKRYDKLPATGHNAVYKMIELNVRVMSLYNAYGTPDCKVQQIAKEVILFDTVLANTERTFKETSGVSGGMKSVFEKYSGLVRTSLEDLRSQFRKLGY